MDKDFDAYYGQILRTSAVRSMPTVQEARRDFQRMLRARNPLYIY